MSFTTAAWHDIWHFSSGRGGERRRIPHAPPLRSRRPPRRAGPTAVPETYAFLVRLAGADLEAARANLLTALRRGEPHGGACERRRSRTRRGGVVTPIEGGRGPSVLLIIAAVVAILFAFLFLPRLFLGGASGPVPEPAPAGQPPGPPSHGALRWSESGRPIEPGSDLIVSRPLAVPVIIEVEVTVADKARRERGESPTFDWTLLEDARGTLHVRLDSAVETGRLMLGDQSVGPTTTVAASATGRLVLLTVMFDGGYVAAWADKWFLGEYHGPKADASFRLSATGEPGSVTLIEMRAYEVR